MIRHGNITIDRGANTVWNNEKLYRFPQHNGATSIKFKLLGRLLLSGGMTAKQLFDVLYADDLEGGPLCGHEVVGIQLNQLRPAMALLGIELRTSRHNGYTVYWAVEKDVA